jgi:hypothetical protein
MINDDVLTLEKANQSEVSQAFLEEIIIKTQALL